MKADNGKTGLPRFGSPMNHDTFESIKTAGDVAAAGLTIGVIAAFLPPMAALFTIIWTGIRIYETETVQKLVRKLGF